MSLFSVWSISVHNSFSNIYKPKFLATIYMISSDAISKIEIFSFIICKHHNCRKNDNIMKFYIQSINATTYILNNVRASKYKPRFLLD